MLRNRLPAALLLLLMLVLTCAARSAHAATPSVSYSTWILSGDTVMLRFVLPAAEADRLSGSAIPVLTVSKLGQYVLEHTAVSASGRDCPAIDQGYDLGKVDPVRVGPGLYGFEIVFRCGAPMSSLVLENRTLFDRIPTHVNFARIETGRHVADQLFTSGRQRVQIADIAAPRAAGLGGYLGLGVLHVLRDLARLCFLVAAAVAAGRSREVLRILAGLTAGYVLALLAQSSGLLLSSPPLIEAFIGFLVALCAVAIIAPQLRRRGIAIAGWPLLLLALAIIAGGLREPRPALLLAGAAVLSAGFTTAITASRAALPHGLIALPAAIFGFTDGFALPALFAPLGLAFSNRVWMSIGYDLGALLAEAGVLALAAAMLALAGRDRFTVRGSIPDRGISARSGSLIAAASDMPALRGTMIELIAAAVFAGLGTFWLVSRLHA